MRRRLVLAISAAVLLAAGAASAALAVHSSGAPGDAQSGSRSSGRQFVGYWMGIDPLDGGDSRRGITRDGRTFSVIGRDTVFTLCDNTDRAVIRGEARSSGSALVSDSLVITCFTNGSSVTLSARYEVLDRNIILETVRNQAGELVDQIVFHRVSAP
jgi:hypothetical protein